jgi:hypothetical protein
LVRAESLTIGISGGRLVRMKTGVVEGEPGIFPDPIARLLRAVSRFVTTRRRQEAKRTQDLEAQRPAQERKRVETESGDK